MERTIWSAHLSDDLGDLQGPISKSKLDRIGAAIVFEQKSFRADIMQPCSRKLIEKWEEMQTQLWKDLPEEQRAQEILSYRIDKEQLTEYGVLLQNTVKHYEKLQMEYERAIEEQSYRTPRCFRCCSTNKYV